MAASRGRSEQARALRSRLLRRLALQLSLWTAFCIVLFTLVQVFVSPVLGDAIAESSSPWLYYSDISDVQAYLEGHPDAQFQPMETIVDNGDTLVHVESGETQVEAAGSSDVHEYVIDSRYAVRDLSFYYFVRSLKLPVAMLLYFVGFAFIVVLALNRSLQYFDDLANAIDDPKLLDGDEVQLPPELSIASRQLEMLQIKVREHEQSAVDAERRKNELVAYIAHDIRTPLTSVIGYLGLLVESPDLPVEKRAAYAGIALDKANKLESLVDEFFEITRYNLGSMAIEREKVDAQLFLQQVVDEFGLAANIRDIHISVDSPEGISAFMDPSKMARALGNVLKNAITYANPGTEVKVACSEEDGRFVVKVSDEGREISEEHLDRIFDQFFREDASRGQGGNAGLGLAIAKEVAVAHGGGIHAESDDGLTAFTIWVPSSGTLK